MTLGCSRLSAFRKVALPLALPGVAASAIFVFVTSWNEVFAASILTLRNRTLPAQVLGGARRLAAQLSPRGRLLPACACARRHLHHPQVPAHDLGAGGPLT